MRLSRERRAGLTLVEMLVALALTVFIMAILSEAFVTGLHSMSKMKALADMEQKLRVAADLLRADLQADHFEGGKRLSQLTASGQPVPQTLPNPLGNVQPNPLPAGAPGRLLVERIWAPYQVVSPELGFVSIREFNTPAEAGTVEGVDNEARIVDRDENDELSMSVRLNSNNRGSWFEAFVAQGGPTVAPPGFPADPNLRAYLDNFGVPWARYDAHGNGRYLSQWAEIMYFLRRDEQRLAGLDPVVQAQLVPTFNLHRRVLALVSDNAAAFDDALASPGLVPTPSPFARPALMPVPPNPINTEVNNAVAYYLHYDVSAFFNPLSNRFWFNSPADVQFPIRRYQLRTGAGPINQGRLESLDFAGRDGADLLLQNVISFDIKVWDPMALVATPEPPAPPVSFYVGAFVDIGHDIFAPPYAPTPDMAGFASGVVLDGVRYRWNPLSPFVNEATVPGYDIPVSGAPAVATPPYLPNRTYDTGTRRNNVAPAPPGADALLPYPAGIVRSQDNPVLPTTIKPAMAIPAIQIKIRVYDPNSEQTREITVVVDM